MKKKHPAVVRITAPDEEAKQAAVRALLERPTPPRLRDGRKEPAKNH